MILLIRLSKIIIISYLLILLSFVNFSKAEPQDIWKKSREIKIKNKKKIEIKQDNKLNQDLPQTIFDKEKLDLSVNKISQSGEIKDNEIIFGLYEPQETSISLNFWSVIDKVTYDRFIKNILKKIKKVSLLYLKEFYLQKLIYLVFQIREKASRIYYEWLIKNQKMNLSDQVVKQNKVINNNSQLIKFLFIHYLSNGQIDKACNYINLKNVSVQNIELDKFKIFCLLNNKKTKQALSQLELTRETNSLDNFFIEKINFLAGISNSRGTKNFDNVFNAHLTVKVINDDEIKFEDFSKNKELRNYFFKSGIANKLLEETMKKVLLMKKIN